MITLTVKSKWFRSFAILLLTGLLLPTATVSAQVSGVNLLQDPSFENSFRTNTYWQQSSTNGVPVCSTTGCDDNSTAKPRTGSNWVWFGGYDFTGRGEVSPEVGIVNQNVPFPSASCDARLQFYLWIGEARSGSDVNDVFRVLVDDRVVFTANATQRSSYSSYKRVSVDVSSYANGAVHEIEFFSRISQQLVTFNLDDVSLTAENCAGGTKGDYTGDGRRDIAVYRPSNFTWYINGVPGSFTFGGPDDIPVPADYNGDGKTDIAVFRASNSTWYINGVGLFLFGAKNDIPVVGDYNGDGKDDIAIFRPSTSTWYFYGSNPFYFGTAGDIPVVGDYNGDGKDDIAVFRPSNSTWYVNGVGLFLFGGEGDIPVVADYTGDGQDEIAVFRPTKSAWYINGVSTVFLFGGEGDVPVVGDYTGDGKADIAVFRPSNGTWYFYGLGTYLYGTKGDIPV